jgi:hypothetical protein
MLRQLKQLHDVVVAQGSGPNGSNRSGLVLATNVVIAIDLGVFVGCFVWNFFLERAMTNTIWVVVSN